MNNMKQIYINEQYIRQLIKETLENLISDNEDDFINPIKQGMTMNECIKLVDTCKFNSIDELKDNEIVLLYDENINDTIIAVTINFDIDYKYDPYDSGDYLTPPSGGYEIRRIIPYFISFYCEGVEVSFKLINGTKECKYVERWLNDYSNEIEEKFYNGKEPWDNPYEPDEDYYRDR